MMQYQRKTIFTFSFLIFALLISHSRSETDSEGDEREFDYKVGGEKGPEHWGELKREWATCKNGKMQSPIDLSNKRVKQIEKSGELIKSYKPANASLKNRGHDIALQWWNSSAGKILINGTDYYLVQGHWHTPSEHTIDGKRYAMELHMVHKSIDSNLRVQIAVVGFLYQIGAPDSFLSKLISNIKSIADKLEERSIGIIDPNEIKMSGNKHYRYMGSLTTPPCTEGVIWSINKEVGTVSKDQIKALRTAVQDYAEMNARPLQPINKRKIELYVPKQGEL